MAGNAESSLESMTSDQLKQLLSEQTSVEQPAVEAEVTETEQAEPEKSTVEEPPKEETPAETEPKEAEPKVRKIKVEGKEIDIPTEKEVEYIQKGYHYEQKMAELKRQREELSKLTETHKVEVAPPPQYTPEQIKEELIRRLNDDPANTLFGMIGTALEARDQRTREERKADISFEMERSESVPHWDSIQARYKAFRDLGDSRETAFLKAENDYYKALSLRAKEKGIEEGLAKAKAKESVDIPGGKAKKATVPTSTIPSDAELRKMSSAELAALLPRREAED